MQTKELLIPTTALLCLGGAYSDENAISAWIAGAAFFTPGPAFGGLRKWVRKWMAGGAAEIMAGS